MENRVLTMYVIILSGYIDTFKCIAGFSCHGVPPHPMGDAGRGVSYESVRFCLWLHNMFGKLLRICFN